MTNNQFLILLLACPFLAYLWPELAADGGILPTKIINTTIIALIFFCNGLTASPTAFFKALHDWRLTLTMQGYNFIIAPLITLLIVNATFSHFLFPEEFFLGTYLIAALPTTVASCAIFTRSVGGNASASLFNAVIGNFAGVFLAPLILNLLLMSNGAPLSFSLGVISINLLLIIFIPLLSGQLCALVIPMHYRAYASDVSKILLLFIIYSAFSTTFAEIQIIPIAPSTIAALSALMALMQAAYLIGAAMTAHGLRFSKQDRIAIMFTAPQKTIALGIPLIVTLLGSSTFAEKELSTGFAILPLLIFNNIQWLTAAWLLEYYGKKRYG